MQKARFGLRRSLTSHELASAKVLLFPDTAKIISMIVRKLSVFEDFAGSLIRSNFANEFAKMLTYSRPLVAYPLPFGK